MCKSYVFSHFSTTAAVLADELTRTPARIALTAEFFTAQNNLFSCPRAHTGSTPALLLSTGAAGAAWLEGYLLRRSNQRFSEAFPLFSGHPGCNGNLIRLLRFSFILEAFDRSFLPLPSTQP